MQNLFNIIKRLLAQHDCVIVPNFGGFVVNDKEAMLSADGETFYPPTKVVYFNQLLTHNDGLLIQEYMCDGRSFNEAKKKVEEDVALVKRELSQKKELKVGDWGYFSMVGKNITFEQTTQVVPCKSSFGLQEFYFPTLNVGVNEETTTEKDEEQPKSPTSYVFRPLLVGSMAAVLLSMLFYPLQRNDHQCLSGLQTSSMMVANLQTEMNQRDLQINELKKTLDGLQQATEGFYLILSDFTSENDARQYIRENGGYISDSLQVLSLKDKYYVSIASASTKKELDDKRNMLDMSLDYIENAYILSVTKIAENENP